MKVRLDLCSQCRCDKDTSKSPLVSQDGPEYGVPPGGFRTYLDTGKAPLYLQLNMDDQLGDLAKRQGRLSRRTFVPMVEP